MNIWASIYRFEEMPDMVRLDIIASCASSAAMSQEHMAEYSKHTAAATAREFPAREWTLERIP